MKQINVLFFAYAFFLSINSIAQSPMSFLLGTDKKIITPIDSAYIAGHSQNRLFQGVHDDIYVKALVLTNNQNTLAILTFDCIGLLHTELELIRVLVRSSLPDFPAEHIVMSSTHTHSGPDVVGLWGKDLAHSGVDPEYMISLVNKAANTIIQAWYNKVHVTAEYASTTSGEEWVYNISEPGELDRSLTVLRFTDSEGKNVATLTNFACHPTFLDAVNDKVSSDYVGGYYQRMDEAQGGMNFFLQGSIGGWVQPEYEEKTPRQAFRRGSELAEKSLAVLSNAQPLEGSNLEFKSVKFNLPVDNLGFRQLSGMGVLKRSFGDSVLTEMAYFEIGNASFATHPGETVPALSHATKAMMNNTGPRFVMGLGMDALGYILKPYFFDKEKNVPHNEYLCRVSLGVNTQDLIKQVLRMLIDEPVKTNAKNEE